MTTGGSYLLIRLIELHRHTKKKSFDGVQVERTSDSDSAHRNT